MKPVLAIVALLTGLVSTPLAARAQQITRAHIDYFLEVALGNDFNARLPGWPQPARVRLAETSLVKSDPALDDAIAELNRIAGRTLLVRSDSAANVEVRYVSPGHFSDVDITLRSGWSRTDIEQADSGRIESGVILMSAKLNGELRLGALRRNLAQVVGLLHGSRRNARSLFYDGNTVHTSLEFEPVDRVVIRILAENDALRGMTRAQVRERLEARYLK